jgi:threonine dehydratase
VLAGIQVPPDTETDFMIHLHDLHYPYTEETENPVYKIFLGA